MCISTGSGNSTELKSGDESGRWGGEAGRRRRRSSPPRLRTYFSNGWFNPIQPSSWVTIRKCHCREQISTPFGCTRSSGDAAIRPT
ncbi:unnamed protein product [Leptidea sinapis]|uniref:Uncharacterized protein n=1 Tax=Leptidea sinapis TaxID=189913 RepID=A0A5E4R9X3_9NEOP|nr:unnamed protein product [Leptidea sinapis]